MMRFLLINPFMDYSVINEIFAIESQNPPLGLLYIASSLEKQGHKVEIIDFCAEKFTEEKLRKLLINIDAVGITVRSPGKKIASLITKNIKEINPDIPVIIGGPHCTLDPKQAMIDIQADICVDGDGEKVITQIARALQGKIKLSEIPGLYYRENNTIKKGLAVEIIEDLDSLPFPSRYLVEKYNYGIVQGGFNLSRGKATLMIINRGCPFNCRFCVNKALTKKFRTRSVKNVIQELKEIDKKFDFVYIIDDYFFVDVNKSVEILNEIIKEKFDLEFAIAGVRVDTVNEELFKKMKKANVNLVAFGIESGNQDVLDFYNKKITLEQIRKAVKLANKAGLLTSGSFILGAPFETKEHLEKTFKFAKELPLDIAVFSPLGYFKGSPLWKEAFLEGKIKKDEFFVISNSKRGLGNFTEEELWNWVLKIFKGFYFRPSYIIKQIIFSIVRRDFRIIYSGIRMLPKHDNVFKYNTIKIAS